ncbi:PTS sugar transporter subunit IIC [Lactobacillus sp. M0398]|uniref:PTS mannose/fructose/sorbose/N-acetylgalactosamine transporter subunit IIC n=1 Tax=unclassified Lactobacillus TaxID=2620435 RepID=UPI0018DDAD6A|nr:MULTISPECIES: PTS sugar transporter subunit IIC [unclassified Lactobacillus]MBI0121276.1 PTS sugar transporter subunit IIC [Lactobacillus sp. M0398]MBI0123423.1 PTS sugar transporter subunit IIC [Lactobacillus sp. W8174]MBI0135512.1 PTS sugar transporter subunit IIC [Lactobacillus sp. W8173]
MLIKTLLIGLVALVGYSEYFLTGASMIFRPIALAPLVGIVLGNIPEAIKVGAAMELAYIGVVEVGISTPQDMVSASVLGTTFALSTGKGISAALTFGLPLSMLVLIVQNVMYIFVAPLYVNKMDEYAKKAEDRKLSLMAFWGGTAVNFLPSVLFIMLAYYFGTGFSKQIISVIPQFVQDGLVVASGLLPAFGFALLIQQMLRKDIVPYMILGFALTAYLKIPIIGIAIFGLVIVMILYYNEKKLKQQMDLIGKGATDDDESF